MATSLQLPSDVESMGAREILRFCLDSFPAKVALACSFQKEESVLLEMLFELEPKARVFAIDTHYLFPETYELWREVVPLDEPLARLVRLGEEHERVELDDRNVESELADHVHEHGRLPLPRAREAEPVAELVVCPAEDILRGQRLDLKRRLRARRQAGPP